MGGHPAILAVPEWPGISETVTNGNGAIALSFDALEHMLREVMDSLFMGVMGNDKPRLGAWVAVQELVIKDILGPLNQIRTIVLVVVRVNVIQNDVVPKLAQVIPALCVGVAAGIWRPHVSRELSKDIAQRSFILFNLLIALCRSYLAEVLMRPRMTGDLVATRVHAFDQ